jgi:hypothetical protein
VSALRPPADIAPARFFTEWLPAAFAREFGAGRRSAADITVCVELVGDEAGAGGRWILDVKEGVLQPRPEGAEGAAPMVSLLQPVRDWRALAFGEGTSQLAPPDASPLDVLFVDPQSRQLMSVVKGTLRFEVTGFEGRTWWMQVKFGAEPGGTSPDATIAIDGETYRAMLERRLAPPEAYFSGKIALLGNTSLAMQLGLAILPRFVSSRS